MAAETRSPSVVARPSILQLPKPVGSFKFTVIRARKLQDLAIVGKQNPVVKIFCGKKSLSTAKVIAGDKTPEWNQSFEMHLDGSERYLSFEVYNDTFLMEILIGKFRMFIQELPLYLGTSWFPLMDNQEIVGELEVCLELNGNSGPQSSRPSVPEHPLAEQIKELDNIHQQQLFSIHHDSIHT